MQATGMMARNQGCPDPSSMRETISKLMLGGFRVHRNLVSLAGVVR